MYSGEHFQAAGRHVGHTTRFEEQMNAAFSAKSYDKAAHIASLVLLHATLALNELQHAGVKKNDGTWQRMKASFDRAHKILEDSFYLYARRFE